jgi:hypothetical protein
MLTRTIPPSPIQRTFNRHLAAFLGPADPALDSRRDRHCAHQVFTVGLNQLARKQWLDGSWSSAWRFLINCRSGQGLFATVSCRDGEQPEFFGLSRGPQATIAVQAKNDLDRLPDVRSNAEEHELCFLSIPGLLVDAFWLRSSGKNSDSDRIVPFFSARKEFQTMRAYSVAEFMEIAVPLANKRLEHMQRLKDEEVGRKNEQLKAANERRAQWRANCPKSS